MSTPALHNPQAVASPSKARRELKIIGKNLVRRRWVYLMLLPIIAYYVIFNYFPMYGILMAFKNFNPIKGILGSEWIGFAHFKDFFSSYYFVRLLVNTLLLNVYGLLFGFPAPILLALLLNELRHVAFKRTVQTIAYLPHFVSTVVICGMITDFVKSDGLINNIIVFFGGERTSMLLQPNMFRTIYVASGIWQEVGWGSIIYLAALSGIDPELYDAAKIDGAGRLRQATNVTLPGILSTIIILLILRFGSMLSVGSEKVLLLYKPSTYETADVISTFVYRKGLIDMNFSYSTAVGLFNSLVNFVLLVTVNYISKATQETSLF